MPSMATVSRITPATSGTPDQARERHARHAGVHPEPAEHHRQHHHRGGQAAALPPQGPRRERRQGRARALAQHPLHQRQAGQERDPHHDRGHQLAAPQPLGHAARPSSARPGWSRCPPTDPVAAAIRPAPSHQGTVRPCDATSSRPWASSSRCCPRSCSGPSREARLVGAAGEHRARRHRQRAPARTPPRPLAAARDAAPHLAVKARIADAGALDGHRAMIVETEGAGAAGPLPAELRRRHHRGGRRRRARSRT